MHAVGEATFRSDEKLGRLGAAAAPLIEDEPNLFREAEPYMGFR